MLRVACQSHATEVQLSDKCLQFVEDIDQNFGHRAVTTSNGLTAGDQGGMHF